MKGRIRTAGALVFGIALVAGAILYAPEQGTGAKQQSGIVATAEAPSRPYIPTRDSDGDGVSDWKEQFEKAAPLPKNQEPTSTVEYTPPQTATGQFGLRLFQNFMYAGGGGGELTEAEQERLIDDTLSSINVRAREVRYSEKHLTLSDDSIASLHDYGNELAAALLLFTSDDRRHEVNVLGDSLTQNDAAILEELTPIRITYRQLLEDLLATPVPPMFLDQHLEIVNLTQAVAQDVAVFEKAHEDPLLLLSYLNKYRQDAAAFENALFAVSADLFAEGVQYEKDEPGRIAREKFGLGF